MKPKVLLFVVVVMFFFNSCEKDDSNVIIDSVEKSDYFPLEIGNYWIYNHYYIDSLGIENEINQTDSIVVTNDTIINDNQYFVLEGTNYPFHTGRWEIIDILRDSNGYLINEKGDIKFSADNFTDVLASKIELYDNDTLYILTYQMEKIINPVTVPAGEFEVLNFKGIVTTSENWCGVKYPRYIDNLYADHVGKVYETYFYLCSPGIFEKRLVRYKIRQE